METFKSILRVIATILVIIMIIASGFVAHAGEIDKGIFYLVNAILIKLFILEDK